MVHNKKFSNALWAFFTVAFFVFLCWMGAFEPENNDPLTPAQEFWSFVFLGTLAMIWFWMYIAKKSDIGRRGLAGTWFTTWGFVRIDCTDVDGEPFYTRRIAVSLNGMPLQKDTHVKIVAVKWGIAYVQQITCEEFYKLPQPGFMCKCPFD